MQVAGVTLGKALVYAAKYQSRNGGFKSPREAKSPSLDWSQDRRKIAKDESKKTPLLTAPSLQESHFLSLFFIYMPATPLAKAKKPKEDLLRQEAGANSKSIR